MSVDAQSRPLLDDRRFGRLQASIGVLCARPVEADLTMAVGFGGPAGSVGQVSVAQVGWFEKRCVPAS